MEPGSREVELRFGAKFIQVGFPPPHPPFYGLCGSTFVDPTARVVATGCRFCMGVAESAPVPVLGYIPQGSHFRCWCGRCGMWNWSGSGRLGYLDVGRLGAFCGVVTREGIP